MKKIKKIIKTVGAAMLGVAISIHSASADISSSALFTGTTNLVNDLMTWMQIFGGSISGAVLVYSLIRRSMADENDQKKWKDKAIVAGVIAVLVVVAGGLIKTITGYYGG